jgi:uncharacterized protein
MHGQFVWYELLTPDAEASKKFYRPLTGWSTQQFDKDYAMWTLANVPVGGVFQLRDEQRAQGIPPNWMPYVEANNVDDVVTLAGTLGGKVTHGPADIPEVGRYAVLQDPQGATFGVYKSSRPSGAWDGTPKLGRFSWHELMTTDYKGAFDFYRKLFGWDKTGEFPMGELGNYQEFGLQGKHYGGMFNRPGEMAQVPPFWLPYVYVPDVTKATAMAKKAGAEVVTGPMEVPGGSWIVVMKDPQGAAFALHSEAPKAGAASKTPAKTKGRAKAKASSKARTAKSKAKPKSKAKAKPKTKAKARKPVKRPAKAKARPKSRAKTKKRGKR